MSREVIIGIGITAGIYLIQKQGGWPALPGRVVLNAGQPQQNVSSVGNKAAMAFLAGLPSIAGIKLGAVDQTAGVTGIWTQVQQSVTTDTDVTALATAFLGAYDAARGADPSNYSPLPSGQIDETSITSQVTAFTPCAVLTQLGVTLSDIGTAACQLSSIRDNPVNAVDSIEDDVFSLGVIPTSTVSPAISQLVAAMDAAGNSTLADQPQNATFVGRVAGATGAAASATADVITTAAGSIASVASILSSPYAWAALVGIGALVALEVIKL